MWDSNVKKKDGFTLVEVLMVVFIIGILSTLAISGYTRYRKDALLELNSDGLISQIYELRDNTIHGDFGKERYDAIVEAVEDPDIEQLDPDTETSAKCFGLYFFENQVKGFSTDFSKKKVWNEGMQDFVAAGCAFNPQLRVDFESLFDLELDSDIEVYEIIDSDGSEYDELIITFFPPDGDIEVKRNFQQSVFGDQIFTIGLKYALSEQDRDKRSVIFDTKSGSAYVTTVE